MIHILQVLVVQVPNLPVLFVLVKRDSETVGNIQDAPKKTVILQ
jgi:hypothetical protein